jgi:hypothetical protein
MTRVQVADKVPGRESLRISNLNAAYGEEPAKPA